MSRPAKPIKHEVKEEFDGNGTNSSNHTKNSSPAVKRETEAAEALMSLSGKDSDKKPTQNGHHEAKKQKIKSEPELKNTREEPQPSTSKDKSSSGSAKKKKKKPASDDEDDSDFEVKKPAKKKAKASPSPSKSPSKTKNGADKRNGKKPAKKGSAASSAPGSPKKRKKEEPETEVWKWWEETRGDGEIKWKTLQHKGPVFAAPYEPLPSNVKLKYEGKELKLRPETEEVAGFYSAFIDHEYSTKKKFNDNFFKDWRKVMSAEEKATIVDLSKCDFTQIATHFKELREQKKAMSKEEKNKIKEQNLKLVEDYGFCMIDGHKERIGNFRIEPPGLFRGRGEHPKMGMLKRRVLPEDVIVNCSSKATAPPPPAGHKWKEVRHDNKVSWLACWTENILGSNKYVMLNPSSKLKGEKDWKKYEVARKLKKCVSTIRENYKADMKSKEMRIRQRAVALYFIDKLALRAGNEKEEGETADTVGCCSLRKEHIKLHDELDGKKHCVSFDFLGKDSIRYQNTVSVDKRVFKNLKIFMNEKDPGDDIFDRLTTTTLNKHLGELMDGLTAKVFRTYNASITLQQQLDELTQSNDSVHEKLLSYNRANRAVAVLCNHQRAIPKTFEKSMTNVTAKIDAAKEKVKEFKAAVKAAKKGSGSPSKEQAKLDKAKESLKKLEINATDREENKTIALGTSKLNYLDPRISVAWCKKNEVPIEKIFNKTQREKFRWAIDMAGEDFVF